MTGDWVVPLRATAPEHQVGGKAHQLRRLMQLGIPVPEGFVVTEAARQVFLSQPASGCASLGGAIERARGDLDPAQPLTTRAAATAIRELLESAKPAERVIAKLERAYRAFSGGDPVIVRSSAVGEDSVSASFAGQLDSIPDVSDVRELREALLACWASRWSERALSYELSHTRLTGMGAIVQRQVHAVFSGVLFTRSPDDGSRILIEYVPGRADALVSGRVNPHRIALERGDLRVVDLGAPLGEPDASVGPDPARFAELARVALRIEAAFGAPQDIEWALDKSARLWIVQARPITTRETARTYWSNANVCENFPQPITPLLYSIAAAGYSHYFRNLARAFGLSRERRRAIERPLRSIIGVHGARMYYNLTSIHALLRAAPWGEALIRAFNRFTGAAEIAPPADPALRGASWLADGFARVRVVLSVGCQYLFLTRQVEGFEDRVDAFARRTHPSLLGARALPELLDDLRSFIVIRCHGWKGASLADAAAMVCYAALQRLLAVALPQQEPPASHNSLLKALPGLVSAEPPLALWKLSRAVRADRELCRVFESSSPARVLAALRTENRFAEFRRQFDDYVECWGFRCSGELLLTTPSFQEDPEPLVELIQAYARASGESPAQLLARQEAERIAETARVLAALRRVRLIRWLPGLGRSAAVRPVLRWTQRAIGLRERARLKQALLYSRLRRIALVIGERLVEGGTLMRADDVFFLSAEELDALLAGTSMFPHSLRELVALRRTAHAALAGTRPLASFRLAAGSYLPLVSEATDSHERSSCATQLLRGTSACGGRVAGRAAVLDDVSQARHLCRGDVLVTPQTDPGWSPVFPLISGLIVERGGMLSHGAIIAREFGIPAVVGVTDATLQIPHGSHVRVDGDRGIVEIARESATC